MKAIVIAFAALLAACNINHKSDQYACQKNTDCPSGRICDNGFCIITGSIDAPRPMTDAPRNPDGGGNNCPSPCTSCNTNEKTCTVNCMQADCDQALLCPAGYKCDFLCNTEQACRAGINCQQSASCNVECTGRASCEDILCGPGRCDIGCTGPQSCRDIQCGNSCACDVTCTGNSSCQSGISCTSVACRSNGGCTSVPIFCNSCE